MTKEAQFTGYNCDKHTAVLLWLIIYAPDLASSRVYTQRH